MKSTFPAAVPEVPVNDLRKALAYYESSLDFTVDWIGDDIGMAGISRGHCRIFLTDNTFRQHRGNSAPVVVWINLDSKEQINDLHNLWKARSAKIVSPPESKPWGLHEFMAADPDGNLFRVFYDFATADRE